MGIMPSQNSHGSIGLASSSAQEEMSEEGSEVAIYHFFVCQSFSFLCVQFFALFEL
jgi:hypothetical protein